jgi:hypothetical protein
MSGKVVWGVFFPAKTRAPDLLAPQGSMIRHESAYGDSESLS